MPDNARLAAVDRPTYDGSQLPRFFDAEQLCAQSLAKKDLVRNPGWFATPADYRKTLELAKTNTRNDEDVVLNLATTEAGDRFKDRGNITVRIPEQWPAHSLIADLLRASNQFERRDIIQCHTMAHQLTLLKKLSGWQDMNITGTINESFGERLSNALELIYFGVDPQKVRHHDSADLLFIAVTMPE
jgi:hypothetical protein